MIIKDRNWTLPEGVKQSVLDCIGNTPLIQLQKVTRFVDAIIAAKIEAANPLWSVKDRIAFAMIEAAERDGKLEHGVVILEPTSGNTGIGLAGVCAAKGYRLAVTMPESTSIEKRRLLRALGAELVLTPAGEGMAGAVKAAERLAATNPRKYFIPQQFKNPANPEIHRQTTAEEIWEATEGQIDILVCGVGTGGTITGVSEVLKARKPSLISIAVEPAASPIISQSLAGLPLTPERHQIMGIGAGFIPENLNLDIIDEVIAVEDAQAKATARALATEEGLFCGISSGAAAWAAIQVASRAKNRGKFIVVVLPDLGERYLSTILFAGSTAG